MPKLIKLIFKRDAWNKQRGISKRDAMVSFELDRDFESYMVSLIILYRSVASLCPGSGQCKTSMPLQSIAPVLSDNLL
jgi:hypothetical protein